MFSYLWAAEQNPGEEHCWFPRTTSRVGNYWYFDCWLAYRTIESKEESSHICLLFRDFYRAQDLIVTFRKVFYPFSTLGNIAEEKKADFSFDLESQTIFLFLIYPCSVTIRPAFRETLLHCILLLLESWRGIACVASV